METSGTGAYTTIPCSRPRLKLKSNSVFVSCFLKTYMEGRYLIASSSSEGQGAGTRFSEKSHLRFFLCPKCSHPFRSTRIARHVAIILLSAPFLFLLSCAAIVTPGNPLAISVVLANALIGPTLSET